MNGKGAQKQRVGAPFFRQLTAPSSKNDVRLANTEMLAGCASRLAT